MKLLPDIIDFVLCSEYVCQFCPKSYSSPSDLMTHLRSHTGERPFICLICHERFMRPSTLLGHVRLHTKPYECTRCGSTYARKQDLKTHQATHRKYDALIVAETLPAAEPATESSSSLVMIESDAGNVQLS